MTRNRQAEIHRWWYGTVPTRQVYMRDRILYYRLSVQSVLYVGADLTLGLDLIDMAALLKVNLIIGEVLYLKL